MPNPYVRENAWFLAADNPIITAYADAVAAMQAKASTDPTSWDYQAAIHGTLAASPLPQWNQCRHGTWYFLSWHRMYLYYFERIVRAQVIANGGPSTWALPYWNYGGGADFNTLPLAFRGPIRPDGSANPLYVSQRAAGINSGAGLSSLVTSAAVALACASFTGTTEFGGGITSPLGQFDGQYGQLETTPHNVVHTAIGGLMGDPDTAAQDPIFWLHHANIDRIWWLWQPQHPGDPSDARWTGQSFSFVDVGGVPVTLSDAEVIDTVSQLDYTYGPEIVLPPRPPIPIRIPIRLPWPQPWPEARVFISMPPHPGPEMPRQLVGATEEPVRLVGEAVRVPVIVDERAVEALRSDPRADDYQHRVFIDIENIDAVRDPGIVYGVFVNLPDPPTSEDLETYHAGNVSLFGVERARNPRGDEHPHSLRYSMEITGVLNRLAAEGSWRQGGRLDVTFRPITLEPPPDRPDIASEIATTQHSDTPVTIGRVGLYFS